MKRRGFTLIELLVVIAIIAILAAILFPVFVNAKERGRQAKCCANLKQLTMAFFEYADDHNGFLPIGSRRMMNWGSQEHNPVEWTGTQWLNDGETSHPINVKRGSLWPYVRNREVYNCPTDRDMPSHFGGVRINGALGPRDSGNAYIGDLPDMAGFGLSYSLNQYLAIKGTSPYKTTVKLGPATTGRASQILFLIHETRGSKTEEGINDGYFTWSDSTHGDIHDKIHWDGTTCSYADGHVKWLPNREMKRMEDAHPSPWWRNSYFYGSADAANTE